MFNQYPYLNLNDLNLDYLLNEIKSMYNDVTNFVSINAIKYANPIQWNITSQYEKNTVVIDPLTGTAYISVAAVPSGVALTRTEYWTVVFDLGSFVTRAAQNFTSHWESETTSTATFASNTGDWVVWGDVLYKAISNIIAGDTYVIGSNIEHFTIEDLYNAYLIVVQQIRYNITTSNQLENETYDVAYGNGALFWWNNELYETTTAVNIGDTIEVGINCQKVTIESLLGVISALEGDLSTLSTTDKSNLVVAINEVFSRLYNNVNAINTYGRIVITHSYGESPDADTSWLKQIESMIPNLYTAYRSGASFGGTYKFIDVLRTLEGVVDDPNAIKEVWVCGGYNDYATATDFISVQEFADYVASEYPNAKIYVAIVGNSSLEPRHSQIRYIVAPYYRRMGAHVPNVSFIENSQYIVSRYDWLASDQIHPNATGANEIAQIMANVIKSKVVTNSTLTYEYCDAQVTASGVADTINIGMNETRGIEFTYFSIITMTVNMTTATAFTAAQEVADMNNYGFIIGAPTPYCAWQAYGTVTYSDNTTEELNMTMMIQNGKMLIQIPGATQTITKIVIRRHTGAIHNRYC